MDFPVGPFAKIDNLSKMCNLENSCKNRWENWQIFPIRQVKSTRKILHALKAFPTFSLVCFQWKITSHIGNVNKKVKTERVSNWIDAHCSCLGFTSFNVSPPLVCTILCMIFKKCLFIEALWKSSFTKYAHYKPLFLPNSKQRIMNNDRNE